MSISEPTAHPPLSLYRPGDVRAMDRVAIDTLQIDSYLLMTRAASDSFATLKAHWSDARRVGVVCGGGNNAGDGYVLARLALDAGFQVWVWAVADPGELSGDAQRAYADYRHRGGQVQRFVTSNATGDDILVDALLGTGLSREVGGSFLEAVRWLNRQSAPVISLDVPSGLDAQSGHAQPEAVRADVTCTFIANKIGLYTGRGPAQCGKVVLCPLDVPEEAQDGFIPVARLLGDADLRRCLPFRRKDSHKGEHGRVLVVGGDTSMGGAAALTAAAALRSGAGSVTVACHPESRVAVSSWMPELMCVGVRHPDDVVKLASNCDVLALGPGLGRRAWGETLFNALIASTCPMVVDADALRWLANASKANIMPNGTRLMTPHPGEAADMLGCSVNAVQQDRLASAAAMASRYGGSVALKGAGSVVASPEGDLRVCDAGNPGMATAGSGDVLTGIAAGLLAQRASSSVTDHDILGAAVYVHAKAGDYAAKRGQRGLIASDILAGVRPCVNRMA